MAVSGSTDRKLSRQRDQRRLLIKTLATQLVMHKSITTSLPKAKSLVPYIERVTAKAQKGDLHARRYVRARLDTVEATHEMIDVIGAQTKRQGGYVRLTRAGHKSGDHTPLATVSFVDTFSADSSKPADKSDQPATKAKSAKSKASPVKKSTTAAKTASKKSTSKEKKS